MSHQHVNCTVACVVGIMHRLQPTCVATRQSTVSSSREDLPVYRGAQLMQPVLLHPRQFTAPCNRSSEQSDDGHTHTHPGSPRRHRAPPGRQLTTRSMLPCRHDSLHRLGRFCFGQQKKRRLRPAEAAPKSVLMGLTFAV